METLSILEQLSRDKGIEKDVLINALKSAVEVAVQKRYPLVKELQSEFNESTGEVEIYFEKTVVEQVDLPDEQISLKDASALADDIHVGEQVLVQQVLENYGRIAAQLAKQVTVQKVREAEIDLIYNDYIDNGSEIKSKEAGKMRLEGKDYIVEDGDIMHFRFNI